MITLKSHDLASFKTGQTLTDTKGKRWTKRPDGLWQCEDNRKATPTVLANRRAFIYEEPRP